MGLFKKNFHKEIIKLGLKVEELFDNFEVPLDHDNKFSIRINGRYEIVVRPLNMDLR